ncbi:S8 family serine peptidase, partial [Candidatus Woesearchaeota archaeon]|nr:S8 family serine peptidase [Candidatus Woesearchaeota archaeon]
MKFTKLKNRKAELATITTLVLALALISTIVLLNQYKGITGFATFSLDNVSQQSIDNEIIFYFNQAGENTAYLDLDDNHYTAALIDITGENISNPEVDILNDGVIDWHYEGLFSSTQQIDFIEILNNYIVNCGSYPCPVPIKVTTQSPGKIIINNLVLEYEYIIEEPEENITQEINLTENITQEITEPEFTKIEQEVIETVEREKRAKVIVILKKSDKPKAAFTTSAKKQRIITIKQEVKSRQNKVLSNINAKDFELKHKYETTSALSGFVTQTGIEKLEADPDVERVILDPVLSTTLPESIPLIKADQAWTREINGSNITGSGETICIVDTGIDYTHPDLNKVIGQYCYCSITDHGSGGCCPNNQAEDFDAMDDNGHGTHCAGIAAAAGVIKGVAPGASIVAVKVCDNAGDCAGSDLIAGIDWCVNNQSIFNISVMGISLGNGAEYNDTNCPDWFDDSLQTANDQGIFIAVASGNEGYSNGINYPACSPYVTSVGATDKSDNIASFTNVGDNLDLLAPGVGINSTVIGGYGVKSGTSMATPHVAGAAALVMQEKRELGEPVTPAEIETSLQDGGVSVSSYERIDVVKTVDEIGGFSVTADQYGAFVLDTGLNVWHCDSSSCTELTPSDTFNENTLRLDTNGGLFVINSVTLDMWHCTSTACTTLGTTNFDVTSITADTNGGVFVVDTIGLDMWHCSSSSCSAATTSPNQNFDAASITANTNGGVFALDNVGLDMWHCTSSSCGGSAIESSTNFDVDSLTADTNNGLFAIDNGLDMWHCTSSACSEILGSFYDKGLEADTNGGLFVLENNYNMWHCTSSTCGEINADFFNNNNLTADTNGGLF